MRSERWSKWKIKQERKRFFCSERIQNKKKNKGNDTLNFLRVKSKKWTRKSEKWKKTKRIIETQMTIFLSKKTKEGHYKESKNEEETLKKDVFFEKNDIYEKHVNNKKRKTHEREC